MGACALKRHRRLKKEKAEILKEIQENPFHYSRQRNERLKAVTVMIEAAEEEWIGLQAGLEKLRKKIE